MSARQDAFVDTNGLTSLSQTIPGGAPITVRIVADSITEGGCRLITWCWTYPRMIHSEIMTHRAMSRNAASSRAIPAATLRQRVLDAPVIPVKFGKNERGMQAHTEVDDAGAARDWWLEGRDLMAAHHARGEALGIHKQLVNRVIEPWMTISTVVSMTDHANFFHLRKHPMAEDNFQVVAELAWELFHSHKPTFVPPGGWHLPYIEETDEELREEVLSMSWKDLGVCNLPIVSGPYFADKFPARRLSDFKVALSTARCARVSYLTHEGKRDLAADFALHKRLVVRDNVGEDPIHASPAEHPAQAMYGRDDGGSIRRYGNFEGWRSYRKILPYENGPDTSDRCLLCGCWSGRHVPGCSNA